MLNEYSYWQQVWNTHVIDEACYITIVSCINAVRLTILNTQNIPKLEQYTYMKSNDQISC
jgi:hypothetical protein